MNMNMNKKLGDNLRFYRKQQGLTLKEMSDKLDITLATYQKYETGQIKHIDIEIIKKFAKALNVPAAILLNWQEEKETIQKEMINNVLDLFQLDEEKDSELIEELQASRNRPQVFSMGLGCNKYMPFLFLAFNKIVIKKGSANIHTPFIYFLTILYNFYTRFILFFTRRANLLTLCSEIFISMDIFIFE